MKKIVFISHISEEKDLALFVKEFIESAFLGLIEVFISSDEHSISLGQKWLNNITDALKKCNIEIVLCSYNSIKKPWINFEAGAGWIRDIPVIPLCHSGMEPSNLPLPLNLLQAAKISDIANMNQLLPVLANAIGSNVPKYDFTEFIAKVTTFEANNTFWNYCNNAFKEIHKINGLIIGTLKQGQNIQIFLAEKDIQSIEKFMPFMQLNNLLELQRSGNIRMTHHGVVYRCIIKILPKLESVINDPNFEFA